MAGRFWEHSRSAADVLQDGSLPRVRRRDAALGRFLGVDPDPEHAESMGTYQYAFANPVMFNDPLGDKGGDYYQNPAERGASGINAVAFHGGYQRISHASEKHWSNALDENIREGSYVGFWDNVLNFANEILSIDIFESWSLRGGFTWNTGLDAINESSDQKTIGTFENIRQFVAISVGETGTGKNRKEAAGVASTLINRMVLGGTNLNDPKWKENSIKKIGGTVLGIIAF